MLPSTQPGIQENKINIDSSSLIWVGNVLFKDMTMFIRLLCACYLVLVTTAIGQEISIHAKENIENYASRTRVLPGKRSPLKSSPHTSPSKVQKRIDTYTDSISSTPASRKTPSKPDIKKHSNAFHQDTSSAIRKHPRSSPFGKICLTAKAEQKEGGRRWVQYLALNDQIPNPMRNYLPESEPSHLPGPVHQWHRKMSEVIACFQHTYTIEVGGRKDKNFSRSTNIAIARLEIHTKSSGIKYLDLPYFFISGWPAGKNRDAIKDLSKKLKEGKLTELFIDREHPSEYYTMKDINLASTLSPYTLQFFSKSYKNGREQTSLQRPNYDQGSQSIQRTLESAKNLPNKIIHEDRIQSHNNFLQDTNRREKHFPKFYFHSEQSIWQRVYAHLEGWCILKEQDKDTISHVIVDICSYFDMCWVCADIGICSLQAQHKQQGWDIYVRCSGNHSYQDIHYHDPNSREPKSLREQRREFEKYEDSHAFDVDPENYKPYIAHSMKEDWHA